jgi:hypothetical protein
MYEEIYSNLSSKIDRDLVKDLLSEYREIKKYHYIGQYELAITKSGKFVETVFQILYYLLSGRVIKNPNFNKISERLLQTNRGRFPESIRLIIPEAAKTIYSIRSKRGATHKVNGISPNFIDCSFVVSTCDWILSEFLRLYHSSDIEEISRIINSLVEKKIPIIEEFGDDIVVLEKELPIRDQILLILYHFYPRMISNKELKSWIKPKYPQIITSNLGKAERDKMVYRRGGESTLTKKGIRDVEKFYSQYLLES